MLTVVTGANPPFSTEPQLQTEMKRNFVSIQKKYTTLTDDLADYLEMTL